MDAKKTKRILRRIINATSTGLTAEVRLDNVRHVIADELCFCGRDWKRGGRRQGSALCQQCFDEN